MTSWRPATCRAQRRDDLGIETFDHRLGISLIEGDVAGRHIAFHLGVDGGGTFLGAVASWHGNAALQVDPPPPPRVSLMNLKRHRSLRDRLADGTQVNGRKLQIMQLVVAQFDFGQRNFAGRPLAAPGIDVESGPNRRGERLQIEHLWWRRCRAANRRFTPATFMVTTGRRVLRASIGISSLGSRVWAVASVARQATEQGHSPRLQQPSRNPHLPNRPQIGVPAPR